MSKTSNMKISRASALKVSRVRGGGVFRCTALNETRKKDFKTTVSSVDSGGVFCEMFSVVLLEQRERVVLVKATESPLQKKENES